MWKKVRHLVLKQYNANVRPAVRRIHGRFNRRKIKSEIQMLENLWEGRVDPDPTELSRRLDNLARRLMFLKSFSTPFDFFFPGVKTEREAKKHRKEMEALESFWPRNEDHIKVPEARVGRWHPSEEAKVPSAEKPWESLGCWVKPHDFHTRATGVNIKVTKDLDSWEFTRNLERGVRSRLGNG